MMETNTRAADAARFFETRTRDDGTTYVTLRDDAPGWLGDAVYDAHAGMLPDDRIYMLCDSAVDWIAEDRGDDSEFADGMVDTYTGDRIAWLGSHLSRPGLCDEAQAEMGAPENGIVDLIALGQYLEASRVLAVIRDACEAGDDA